MEIRIKLLPKRTKEVMQRILIKSIYVFHFYLNERLVLKRVIWEMVNIEKNDRETRKILTKSRPRAVVSRNQ